MSEHDDLEFLDGDDAHDELDFTDDPPPLPNQGEGPERSDPEFWIDLLGGDRVARTIVQDRAVAEAIRGERFGALYTLLQKRRKASRSVEEQRALETVLAERRYFFDPMRGAPAMVSVWGFGSAAHGRQDPDPSSGTYITTLFLTALFIPLWPLKQYLVADAEGGGWYFLGKVPISPKVKMWRTLVTSAVVALVLFAAFAIWKSSTHDDVHFLNGLPEEVTIAFGGETVVVPPLGRETREIAEGDYDVRVTTKDGRVLDERTVHVDGGHDLVAYNVLGASPLYMAKIAYYANVTDRLKAKEPELTLFAGTVWINRADVDHVFEDPPEEISMGEREKVAHRTQVGMRVDGLQGALVMLLEAGRMEDAVALARRAALAVPNDQKTSASAYSLLISQGGADAANGFVDELIATAPDAINAHRLYQGHWQGQGDGERIKARYEAAWRAAPDDPRHAYLYARILGIREGRAIVEPMLAKHPEDRWLRRSLAWMEYQTGNFAAALPHYRKLGTQFPAEAGTTLGHVARCLVATGKRDEAQREVLEFIRGFEAREGRTGDGLGGGSWMGVYGLYALLRWDAQADQTAPTVLSLSRPRLGPDMEPKLFMAMLAGWARNAHQMKRFQRGQAPGDPGLKLAQLNLQTFEDIDAAVQQARSMSLEELSDLDGVALIALAAGFAGAGEEGRATELLSSLDTMGAEAVTIDHLRSLPDVSWIDEDMDIELRAALLLAASQRAKDDAGRSHLLAQARRYDPLGRVVR